MYRFLIITGTLIVAALIGVLALSSVDPRPDVILVNGEEVHNLDPARMTWMHDIRTAFGLWEGLLSMNPRTLTPEPAVATRYDVSPDGRTYTFHLRPDARWSNGDPVTAHDFRFAWMRLLEPANASGYYNMMLPIVGAREYYDARKPRAAVTSRPDASSVGIDVLDDHTLRVRLTEPVPWFPEFLAFSAFLPLHRASMQPFLRLQDDGAQTYDDGWLKPSRLVTNGPFTLERWDFKYRLALAANPHYWDRAHVASRRIELLAEKDTNTAFKIYASGGADLITSLPESAAPELIRQSRLGQRDDLHVFPVWGTYYYRFNCRSGATADPLVRAALTMTIDRKAIAEQITRRGEHPQTSFVSPGMNVLTPPGWTAPATRGPGWIPRDNVLEYLPADGLPFDPDRARLLLTQAGYGPAGKPFPKTTLLINDSPAHRDIAQFVIKQWRDLLDVSIELESQSSEIAGARMREHKFQIARSGWFTDYGDPTGFLELFKTGDGNNDGQFSNPEYDRLLADAARTTDPARRLEMIHRAEQILVHDQAGIAPIYQYVGQFMFRPNVTGIWENPKQQIMLKYVGKR